MGNSANSRYAIRNSVRFWKRFSFMAGSFVADGAHALHPVVEDETQQQDDEEIDQREGGRRAQVELADRLGREVLAEERGRIARPAPREHEGLGVDHETV